MCFPYFCVWVCGGSRRGKAIKGKTQHPAEDLSDLPQARWKVHVRASELEPRDSTCGWLQKGRDKGPCTASDCPALHEDSLYPFLLLKWTQILIRETGGSRSGKVSIECTPLSMWKTTVIKLPKQFPEFPVYAESSSEPSKKRGFSWGVKLCVFHTLLEGSTRILCKGTQQL